LLQNFTSEINCFINENKEVNEHLNDPLLFLNEFISYEQYFNRSISDKNEEFQFGLTKLLAYNRVLNQIEKIHMFNALSNDKDIKANWFSENSFGVCKAGEKNMTLIGDVKNIDINKLKK
jgi:hypothetical protein